MKIVIDTSILIAVIIGEEEKPLIIEKTKNSELIAPYSVHWEIVNALSAILKKHKINIKDINKAINIYSKIPIEYIDVDLRHSLELCDKYNIYAYDAYILSCALKNKLVLFSLDKKINEIAKELEIKFIKV